MNATAVQMFPFDARSYAFQEYVPCKNLIGGEWRDAEAGATFAIENPRHGRTMGQVAWSGAADVDAAVQAAAKAAKTWRHVPIRERGAVFYRLKELMQRDIEELAWLVSHENGKTFAEAKAEVEKGIECVEFGASLPNIAAGEQRSEERRVGKEC